MKPPEWIVLEDGSRIPFEPEEISRDLFEATRQLGSPNPFLARELTDSVIHFLSLELEDRLPTKVDIQETIIKVVRELGHAELATLIHQPKPRSIVRKPKKRRSKNPRFPSDAELNNHFQQRHPQDLGQRMLLDRLTRFSDRQVYPSDMRCAGSNGLIDLYDRIRPFELVAQVLRPTRTPWHSISAIRDSTQQYLSIDSPEYLFLDQSSPGEELYAFAREIHHALQAKGLKAYIHLNCLEPPRWASAMDGPLFAGATTQIHPVQRLAFSKQLAQAFMEMGTSSIRVCWHISEADFTSDLFWMDTRFLLSTLWILDRPNRPIHLGCGLDRDHPAVLGKVGIHLKTFWQELGGEGITTEVFFSKWPSLVRFAKSVGHVRQDFLRKQGPSSVKEGFLLERSRFVILLHELTETAVSLAASEASSPGKVAEVAKQILQITLETLIHDRPRYLDTVVESDIEWESLDRKHGLQLHLSDLTVRQEIRFASSFQSLFQSGCLYISVPENPLEIIKQAWESGVVRLQFI